MRRQRSKVDVFDYLDYRAFLTDVYEAKKAEGRGFSFRVFSRLAGLRAPNHLKRIIVGERNLTATMARRYAQALKLGSEEGAYFCDLVEFNQATTSDDRNAAYARLTGSRRYRRAHVLDVEHAAYHAEWYIPVIREMVVRPDFQESPAWIAPRLVPPISQQQAERALETLLALGLLQRNADGRLVQGEAVVSTGPQTRSLHISNYHRAMLGRAIDAIDTVPAPSREISSLTFAVGEDGLRKLKERIQRFQQEIIALASQEDEFEQVVQLNFQLFPLTTTRSEEPKP